MPPVQGRTEQNEAFERIMAALLETERGRAFLAEHARRHRVADTRTLLEAIGRLEGAIHGRRIGADVERLRTELADMSAAIGRGRAGTAGTEAPPTPATVAVIEATERIQETAWTMREGGIDPALCDALDERATEIYAACEVRDATAGQLERALACLTTLETRIEFLRRTWGEPAGPPLGTAVPRPPDLTPSDIDFVVVAADAAGAEDPFAGDARPPDPLPGHGPALDRLAALATRDRLALFT